MGAFHLIKKNDVPRPCGQRSHIVGKKVPERVRVVIVEPLPDVGHFFARMMAAFVGYHGTAFFLFSFLPDVGQFSGKFSGKKKHLKSYI